MSRRRVSYPRSSVSDTIVVLATQFGVVKASHPGVVLLIGAGTMILPGGNGTIDAKKAGRK